MSDAAKTLRHEATIHSNDTARVHVSSPCDSIFEIRSAGTAKPLTCFDVPKNVTHAKLLVFSGFDVRQIGRPTL